MRIGSRAFAGLQALLLCPLLGGCFNFPPMHKTAKGIEIHIDADVTAPASDVDRWVDLRFEEWVAHKSDWGCGKFSDRDLLDAARSEPIIIRGGYFLAGSMAMGLNYFDEFGQERIVVSINFPAYKGGMCAYDPDYVKTFDTFDYSYGLRQLPHEWTHTVRGRWHP